MVLVPRGLRRPDIDVRDDVLSTDHEHYRLQATPTVSHCSWCLSPGKRTEGSYDRDRDHIGGCRQRDCRNCPIWHSRVRQPRKPTPRSVNSLHDVLGLAHAGGWHGCSAPALPRTGPHLARPSPTSSARCAGPDIHAKRHGGYLRRDRDVARTQRFPLTRAGTDRCCAIHRRGARTGYRPAVLNLRPAGQDRTGSSRNDPNWRAAGA